MKQISLCSDKRFVTQGSESNWWVKCFFFPNKGFGKTGSAENGKVEMIPTFAFPLAIFVLIQSYSLILPLWAQSKDIPVPMTNDLIMIISYVAN